MLYRKCQINPIADPMKTCSFFRLATLLLLGLVILPAPAAPPIPAVDNYSTSEDTTLVVPAATGVLSNDNANGNPAIQAVSVAAPAHGALSMNADGSFSYTPTANYNGPDSFTYKARSVVQPIVFDINPALSNSNIAVTIKAPS